MFTHSSTASDRLAVELQERIEVGTGFEVPVILRTAEAWSGVVAANPYPDAEPMALHVAFLSKTPAPEAVKSFDPARFAPEEFTVVGREVYLHLPDGMGRAKLPPALPLIRGYRDGSELADGAQAGRAERRSGRSSVARLQHLRSHPNGQLPAASGRSYGGVARA